jgi:hypothetical protein
MQGAGIEPEAVEQAVWFAQVVGGSILTGWLAESLLDSGLRVRGGAMLVGLAGLYLGGWAATLTGWSAGPSVAGYAVVPAFAGALAVTAMAKLVSLGVAGPRR